MAFHGVPEYVDHSIMPRDTPLYMLDNTVEDTSEDNAPTALANAGNDEKIQAQAHYGNPGAIFFPMDVSLTHEGALVTPPV